MYIKTKTKRIVSDLKTFVVLPEGFGLLRKRCRAIELQELRRGQPQCIAYLDTHHHLDQLFRELDLTMGSIQLNNFLKNFKNCNHNL